MADARRKRTRLAPEARRRQILDAASAILLKQGYLPLPLDQVARDTGVSKALVYNYFPTQHDLFNAMLEREFLALSERGIEKAIRAKPLMEAAIGAALAYFDHVAERGPVIHIILRDQYMVGKLSREIARQRDRVVRRLAEVSRRELVLGAKENIAAINLAITIPEEAGRLAYAGEIGHDRARQLCEQLVRSSVEALTPRRS